jgi:hypothetical protein
LDKLIIIIHTLSKPDGKVNGSPGFNSSKTQAPILLAPVRIFFILSNHAVLGWRFFVFCKKSRAITGLSGTLAAFAWKPLPNHSLMSLEAAPRLLSIHNYDVIRFTQNDRFLGYGALQYLL